MATRTGKQAKAAPAQRALPFRCLHGGRRAGSGRKAGPAGAGVRHRPRAVLAARFPVHVTVKVKPGLPALRQRAEYAALRAAFAATNARAAGAGVGAFRLCEYSVQDDHLHLLVEADGSTALSRGAQSLLIRVAKGLNKVWARRGSVFADRYHARILTTPRDVRHVLRYVFGNARKHAASGSVLAGVDVFTSAPWFDGFREAFSVRNLPAVRPTVVARTWLLRAGWRRHGLLSVYEGPVRGAGGATPAGRPGRARSTGSRPAARAPRA